MSVLSSDVRSGSELSNLISRLPPEILSDLRSFIRVSSNLKQLAKSCNPAVIREASKMEKFKRAAIDSVRKSWLEHKIIDEATARAVIRLIHEKYDDALSFAENKIALCLR